MSRLKKIEIMELDEETRNLFENIRNCRSKKFFILYEEINRPELNNQIIECAIKNNASRVLLGLYKLGVRACPTRLRRHLEIFDQGFCCFDEQVFKKMLLLYEGIYNNVYAQVLYHLIYMGIDKEDMLLYLFEEGIGHHLLESDHDIFPVTDSQELNLEIRRKIEYSNYRLFSIVVRLACQTGTTYIIDSYRKLHVSQYPINMKWGFYFAIQHKNAHIIINYLIENNLYNKEGVEIGINTLSNFFGYKVTNFKLLDLIIPLTEDSSFFGNIPYSHVDREFGSPKKAVLSLPKERSAWLKPLLKRYFSSSKKPPFDYLKVCPDWQKEYVMAYILEHI